MKGKRRKKWCLASLFLLGIFGSSTTEETFRGFNQFKVNFNRGLVVVEPLKAMVTESVYPLAVISPHNECEPERVQTARFSN